MLAVAEWPRRQLVKASCLGFDPPAALAGVVMASPQLFWLKIARGAELPVGIGVPVHTIPRLALRQPSEAHLHPVLLDQRCGDGARPRRDANIRQGGSLRQ